MRIRITELLANIRTHLVAFFSIALFVGLGVGLFVGIQWVGDGLKQQALKTVDDAAMYDIQIQFPYGIDEDDLARIREVSGVSEVEPAYMTFATMESQTGNATLRLQSLTERICQLHDVEGTLPSTSDEIAVLRFWAEEKGIGIGDVVQLSHDADETDDADETEADDEGEGADDDADKDRDPDGMAYLKQDSFRVTALVDSSEYLYANFTSFGISNTASGVVDGVAYVIPEVFDADAFRDSWPVVYVRSDELRDRDVFSDDYVQAASPLVAALDELGGELATARYHELRGEAQDQIDEAQRLLDDGERQLKDARKKLRDGEKQLADAEKKLEDGQEQLLDSVTASASQQADAAAQLQDAHARLADGQAQYDAGLQSYESAKQTYKLMSETFERLRPHYDTFVKAVELIQKRHEKHQENLDTLRTLVAAYEEDPDDSTWAEVEEAYQTALADSELLRAAHDALALSAEVVRDVLGIDDDFVDFVDDFDIPAVIEAENAGECIDAMQRLLDASQDRLDRIQNASVEIGGVTIRAMDVDGGLQALKQKLDASEQELANAKSRLDAGWAEYYAGKEAYDAAVAAGKAELQSARDELAEGRKTLKEKADELEKGKGELADAQAQLDKLVEYEWTVVPRHGNGGFVGLRMVSGIVDRMKWTLALLFILVGLFVCYSSIARLVHEQINQIGTKKAIGFTPREVAGQYLWFSALAVALGCALAVLVGTLLVQTIVTPEVIMRFTLPSYGYYVSLPSLLFLGGIELVLILGATWLAIRGLLAREARDLLAGESTASATQRFYERTRLWKRLSLFSQTVVNNCVNDSRRVLGTVVGVLGCTALIVTAVTIRLNVGQSFVQHYEDVYDFDALAYLEQGGDEEAMRVALALYHQGVTSTPAHSTQVQIRQDDDTRVVANIMVPVDAKAFDKFYRVQGMDGTDVELGTDGVWISSTYAESTGLSAGDELVVTEFSGRRHTLNIAGVYLFRLMRHELVMGPELYEKTFGKTPDANVLLVNSGGEDITELASSLEDVEGFYTLIDDKTNASLLYDTFESMLNSMVLVYLALSALMALLVLLNLDVMFVEEKKRELIVLMINGFSVGDAKAYIYRDSIVLTIVGIALGIALGAGMGAFSIVQLQPDVAYWIRGFNMLAAGAGALGAGVLAVAVLLWSLRRIPRFDLTDINRF